MNFFKKLFSSNKDNKKTNIEWNDLLKKVYESIADKDDIKYPIILFCHVIWDFEVYKNPTEIIEQSISGHWGLFPEPFDPKEIVIDSDGKVFKLNKEHYDEKTKTGFSYPSIFFGNEDLDSLKKRILDGCNDYILQFQENEEIIKTKIETVNEINSIPELIYFSGKELNF